MIGRISLTAAMMFCLFELAGSEQPAGKWPNESTREVVYFGPAGPVRIRLHLAINGRSADAAWTDAINGLFAFRDKDNDGFLNASEVLPLLAQPVVLARYCRKGFITSNHSASRFLKRTKKSTAPRLSRPSVPRGLAALACGLFPVVPNLVSFPRHFSDFSIKTVMAAFLRKN